LGQLKILKGRRKAGQYRLTGESQLQKTFHCCLLDERLLPEGQQEFENAGGIHRMMTEAEIL
jgi:hypothetical protein